MKLIFFSDCENTEKNIFSYKNDRGLLFDIEQDPGELKNLWNDSEYQISKYMLTTQLFSWLSSCNYRSHVKKGQKK
jgi:hypothetical protein